MMPLCGPELLVPPLGRCGVMWWPGEADDWAEVWHWCTRQTGHSVGPHTCGGCGDRAHLLDPATTEG